MSFLLPATHHFGSAGIARRCGVNSNSVPAQNAVSGHGVTQSCFLPTEAAHADWLNFLSLCLSWSLHSAITIFYRTITRTEDFMHATEPHWVNTPANKRFKKYIFACACDDMPSIALRQSRRCRLLDTRAYLTNTPRFSYTNIQCRAATNASWRPVSILDEYVNLDFFPLLLKYPWIWKS